MSDNAHAQEILDFYPRLIAENYCIMASSALLWFDFSLTFTTEVRRIWRRKLSGATFVYLLTRYVALVGRFFFVIPVLLWKSSDEICIGLTRTNDALTILNYLAFSAFTILRIYGVWGRDWRPIVLVAPLTLVKPVLLMRTVAAYTPFQGGPPWGCLVEYHISYRVLGQFSTTAKATTIASDVVLIALTWYQTFGINKTSIKLGMRTPLATLLLRDGTAYFLVLLLIQTITIVSSQIGKNLVVWQVWPYFEQVLTVIFLSRFMLDLRGLYFSERDGGGTSTLTGHGFSDIRFTTSSVVGNLGATLRTTLSDSDSSVSSVSFANAGVESTLGASDGEEGGIREVRRDGAEAVSAAKKHEEAMEIEWYDDEPLEYVSAPFVKGMKIASSPAAGSGEAPRVAEIAVADASEEPASPGVSPV